MSKKKSLQELTIKDNFMFGAVMMDPENCKGTNDDEVPLELVRFLKFVAAPLSDSESDFEDAFVQKLQSAVREVKSSREMGAKYMTFEEYLYEEREDAREEGRAEGLAEGLAENVRKKLDKGDTLEKISEDLVEDPEVIRQIMDKLL